MILESQESSRFDVFSTLPYFRLVPAKLIADCDTRIAMAPGFPHSDQDCLIMHSSAT